VRRGTALISRNEVTRRRILTTPPPATRATRKVVPDHPLASRRRFKTAPASCTDCTRHCSLGLHCPAPFTSEVSAPRAPGKRAAQLCPRAGTADRHEALCSTLPLFRSPRHSGSALLAAPTTPRQQAPCLLKPSASASLLAVAAAASTSELLSSPNRLPRLTKTLLGILPRWPTCQ
jgi:hypothetical protein